MAPIINAMPSTVRPWVNCPSPGRTNDKNTASMGDALTLGRRGRFRRLTATCEPATMGCSGASGIAGMAGDWKPPMQCGQSNVCPASAGFSATWLRQCGQMSMALGLFAGWERNLSRHPHCDARGGDCKEIGSLCCPQIDVRPRGRCFARGTPGAFLGAAIDSGCWAEQTTGAKRRRHLARWAGHRRKRCPMLTVEIQATGSRDSLRDWLQKGRL